MKLYNKSDCYFQPPYISSNLMPFELKKIMNYSRINTKELKDYMFERSKIHDLKVRHSIQEDINRIKCRKYKCTGNYYQCY